MKRILATAALLLCSAPAAALATATFTIVNNDGAGEGFNDPTPAAPIGGNVGTTRGQQRLIAFQAAADIWSVFLDSDVEILLRANFDPLTCTPTSAVLGSAGAWWITRDFPNAPRPGTWYHAALANSLAGFRVAPTQPYDMSATFNTNLGNPGCLAGSGWYLGLDANPGSQIDLVSVLLHEFAHGIGFSAFFDKGTGAHFILDIPDAYEAKLLDITSGLPFPSMSNAQRAAATQNTRRVVWNGALVTSSIPETLAPGTPLMTISSPPSLAGEHLIGTATFGSQLTPTPVSGEIHLVNDGAGVGTDACEPIPLPIPAGRIALVDRGTCDFTIKALNVQNAGGIAMIMADDVAGSPPPDMGGVEPLVVIPSVRITQATGLQIKAALMSGPVTANLFFDATRFMGADALGRGLLYTPVPMAPGSSISHWDTSAFPNLLMEPFINADLTHSVDIALPLLRDMGWPECHDDDDCSDGNACNGEEICSSFGCNTGTPLECNDANVCTADTCDSVSGCVNTPTMDGSSCADGNVCNGAETCTGGSCGGGAPLACDDGNLCTAEACDAVSGCSSSFVAAGTACGGGGTCNGAGACVGAVCKSVKLNLTSPAAGPLPPNSNTTFTATNVSCGSGQTPEYRFFYRRAGGPTTYTPFTAWSTSPIGVFDNTGLPSGQYTFQARARRVGSTVPYDSVSALIVLSADVCPSVSLAIVQPPPKAPGTILDLIGTATCTGGSAEYKFFHKPPGASAYTVLRGWGGPNFAWDSTGAPVGVDSFLVYARAAGNANYESSMKLMYLIADKCTASALTASPPSPRPAGTPITLLGEASCEALSTPNLRYLYRRSGTTPWIQIQTWSPSTSAPWTTAGLVPGTYQLRLEARAPGLNGDPQSTKIVTFVLN